MPWRQSSTFELANMLCALVRRVRDMLFQILSYMGTYQLVSWKLFYKPTMCHQMWVTNPSLMDLQPFTKFSWFIGWRFWLVSFFVDDIHLRLYSWLHTWPIEFRRPYCRSVILRQSWWLLGAKSCKDIFLQELYHCLGIIGWQNLSFYPFWNIVKCYQYV